VKPQADSSSVETLAADPIPYGDLWDCFLIALIFAGMIALAWIAIETTAFQPLAELARKGRWGSFWGRPTIIWITMGVVLLFLRTVMWLLYRPAVPARSADAPFMTVIVPAYNEGPTVESAIASVAAADYPRDRLEIIVIDDGSTDQTWRHIRHAAFRHSDLVGAVRLPQNLGKRGALAEGFRRARGEVLVTVDSDSVIERGALLAVAGPFRDPRVGAVAGKVSVRNRRDGLIPRMLHVQFTLSFDFLRSVQSVFRTVFCCPGALSAYRASAVRQVLTDWERQTFLGSPCTHGEDRALTNSILGAGFDTVYQRTAVVHTEVPDTYAQLCRMYLRWDRSYIREELRLAKIVWARPLSRRFLIAYDFVITDLRYPVGYAAIVLWAVSTLTDPTTLVRMLLAIMVVSLLNTLYFLRSERSWEFAFGILYAYYFFFALTWVFPYAAVTPRARGWLTR
jgi:hyaluronan synthase